MSVSHCERPANRAGALRFRLLSSCGPLNRQETNALSESHFAVLGDMTTLSMPLH